MYHKKLLLAAAITGVMAMTAIQTAAAADDSTEKCYGVAKAGKNDCATASHSCAGSSKKDNDPAEWKKMPQAECEKAGGKVGGDDKKPM